MVTGGTVRKDKRTGSLTMRTENTPLNEKVAGKHQEKSNLVLSWPYHEFSKVEFYNTNISAQIDHCIILY